MCQSCQRRFNKVTQGRPPILSGWLSVRCRHSFLALEVQCRRPAQASAIGRTFCPHLLSRTSRCRASFERVAVTHHRRTALVSDGRQWTYAELNAVANHLAHIFVSHGGAPGDQIAILMQHDAPSVAAAVAVLKASRIVVALNPTHPLVRLRELIEDSEPFFIVTDASLRNVAKEIAGLRCALVDFEDGGRTRGRTTIYRLWCRRNRWPSSSILPVRPAVQRV